MTEFRSLSTSRPQTRSYGTWPTSSVMSTPRYRRTPPSLSGSAISVSTATTPSSPGLKSLTGWNLPGPGRHTPGIESGPVPHRVTLIPGDGTGPELSEATRRVLEATGVEFDWDVQQAGTD